jgi:heavy metal sensor kinase
MFRSIRWTLQLWHGVILLAALLSLGAALYTTASRERFNRVDAELQNAAQLVAGRVAPPPPARPPPPRVRPRPPGPPDPLDELFGLADDDAERDRPRPLDRQGEPGERQQSGRIEQVIEDVPQNLLHRPGEPDADQPYFVVWALDGHVVRASAPAENLPETLRQTTSSPSGQAPDPVPRYRNNCDAREIVVRAPRGLRVLVGRSVRRERDELRSLMWTLVAAGGGVMVLGLAGGWLLARRATAPIRAISETARAISATDLSKRIDVDDAKSELGSLAQTLNETFERLDAAFRQQVRFTADASHELRTPLSVMHTHLELALSRERTPEEYRQSLATCLRAAKRMRSLVDSLLTLARADAGRLELRREPFDLSELVGECQQMLAPLAEQRGLSVDVKLAPAPVVADRNRVAQVVTNLMNNAIAYNRDGGRVRVEVSRDNGCAVLTVADTGVGIAADEQSSVFTRFFRADKARTREAGGSGLGLAICKSIVDAHRGRIEFTSRPDEGTTFTVRLPSN